MTPKEALHDFIAQMTYGHDQGVVQIWLSRTMYQRLYMSLQDIPMYETTHNGVREHWDDHAPPYIEFEGVRIYADASE